MTGATVGLRAYRATEAVMHAASPRSLRLTVEAIWHRHRELLTNSLSLLGTTAVTSGLGFTFWAVAAREFSQQAVGYGSAAVSAMSLLSTIGIFGLGTVLIGELPKRNHRAGLVSASLLASGISSLILGLGFAVIASISSKRFEVILGKPTEALVFAVGVALGAAAFVFDSATIGLLRGGVQLTRNLVFSVVKMAALPVTAIFLRDQFGSGIFLSWAGGVAVSLAVSAIWLRIQGSPIFPRPDWSALRALRKTALAHNWLNIAIAVPVTLIPVLVTAIVSPEANAAFYIAWMLTSFVYSVPGALSLVLFAVASADPRVIAGKMRFALKLSLLIGVPALLVLCFGAPLILSLFGKSYVQQATFPMWLLSLAYIPALPKSFYVAVCRADGRITKAAVVLTSFSAIEIVAAGIGGHFGGLKGLSIAIVAVTLIEGVATTPAVLRATRRRGGHLPVNRRTKSGVSLQLSHRNNQKQQEEGLAVLTWLASQQARASDSFGGGRERRSGGSPKTSRRAQSDWSRRL